MGAPSCWGHGSVFPRHPPPPLRETSPDPSAQGHDGVWKRARGAPGVRNSTADAHRDRAEQRTATSGGDPAALHAAHPTSRRRAPIQKWLRAGTVLTRACRCRQGSHLRLPPRLTAPSRPTVGIAAACCCLSCPLARLEQQSWDEPTPGWKRQNINIPRRMQKLQQRARRPRKRGRGSGASPSAAQPASWILPSLQLKSTVTATTRLLCRLPRSPQASTGFCLSLPRSPGRVSELLETGRT